MGGDVLYSCIQSSPGYHHSLTTESPIGGLATCQSPIGGLATSKLVTESPSGGINTITSKLEGLRVGDGTPECVKLKAVEERALEKQTGGAYGDGDQSPLYGTEADTLLTKWCSGLDYNPEHNKTLSSW